MQIKHNGSSFIVEQRNYERQIKQNLEDVSRQMKVDILRTINGYLIKIFKNLNVTKFEFLIDTMEDPRSEMCEIRMLGSNMDKDLELIFTQRYSLLTVGIAQLVEQIDCDFQLFIPEVVSPFICDDWEFISTPYQYRSRFSFARSRSFR